MTEPAAGGIEARELGANEAAQPADFEVARVAAELGGALVPVVAERPAWVRPELEPPRWALQKELPAFAGRVVWHSAAVVDAPKSNLGTC